MAEKFIQAAREKMESKGTVGALHQQAGVSESKTIPDKKLSALEKKARGMKGEDGKMSPEGLKLLRRVQFARNAGGK